MTPSPIPMDQTREIVAEVRLVHGAVRVGVALARALRPLPNEELRRLADELEGRQ